MAVLWKMKMGLSTMTTPAIAIIASIPPRMSLMGIILPTAAMTFIPTRPPSTVNLLTMTALTLHHPQQQQQQQQQQTNDVNMQKLAKITPASSSHLSSATPPSYHRCNSCYYFPHSYYYY
jgi:hypothetical protein